ncbi:hypothetical protein SAMN05892883_2491 [Jatrophihabitans sp. GAS493]|nr:hypothetical protein SAMN05892883_2491 [Jatrophihabitans sp. GAS493]
MINGVLHSAVSYPAMSRETGAYLRLRGIAAVCGLLGTLALLRLAAWPRILRLDSSTVVAAGEAGGPGGTLSSDGETLTWWPDKEERKRGDQPMSWPLDQVHWMEAIKMWDIAAGRVIRVQMAVPEGSVVVGIFHQQGGPVPFRSS